MHEPTGRPRRPTMHDVAQAAGVSLSTVSRVLNNHGSVRPETHQLVVSTIDRLGFRRNSMAAGLRRQRTYATIGLIIQDLANPFYSTIARGIEEVAHNHGHMVVAGSAEYDVVRERGLVGSLLERQVDGLLIVPTSHDHVYLQHELNRGTPIVLITMAPVNLRADAVVQDSLGPARTIVTRLLARGRRRIGVIAGRTRLAPVAERLAGYRQALEGSAVPVDETLIAIDNRDADQAEAAARSLLGSADPPDAFFTTSNRMTVGLLRALGTRPVEIAAFDEIEAADAIVQPITMVVNNPLELGQAAAEALFDRINGDSSAPRKLLVPSSIVSRPKSVGQL